MDGITSRARAARKIQAQDGFRPIVLGDEFGGKISDLGIGIGQGNLQVGCAESKPRKVAAPEVGAPKLDEGCFKQAVAVQKTAIKNRDGGLIGRQKTSVLKG